jgi:hypothetical protein
MKAFIKAFIKRRRPAASADAPVRTRILPPPRRASAGVTRRAQVQALRAIERYLGLDALYVLGTNCVDNGPRAGLDKFLNAASADPGSVLHYEFMQARRRACARAQRARPCARRGPMGRCRARVHAQMSALQA